MEADEILTALQIIQRTKDHPNLGGIQGLYLVKLTAANQEAEQELVEIKKKAEEEAAKKLEEERKKKEAEAAKEAAAATKTETVKTVEPTTTYRR